MFNETAFLITRAISYDSLGNSIAQETKKEVFVQKKSIRMREFYSAAEVGLKPDFTLVLADYYDYNNEKRVEYDGKVYDITRIYRRANRLELTITERTDRDA